MADRSDGAPLPALHRLHPSSLLFSLGQILRQAGTILFFALFAARGAGWDLILLITFLPTMVFAVLRYLTYGYRFADGELIVQEGLFARRARHIPYDRVQNIEQRQGPVHRMLGVVELRLQTGSGSEPEASLRVLSLAAADELRTRIGAARPPTPTADTGAGPRVVLELGLRDVMLHGLLHGRSLILIAALWGALWQWSESLGVDPTSLIQRLNPQAMTGRVAPVLASILGALVLLAAALLVLRLLSVAWALLSTFGFVLTRDGDLLRTSHGLISRFAATIPRHRIQVLTVRQSVLDRWLDRAVVQVETAGSFSDDQARTLAPSLAPIVRRANLAALVSEALPNVDLDHVAWQPIDPRGVARIRRRAAIVGTLLCFLLWPLTGAWSLLIGALWMAHQSITAPWTIGAWRYALLSDAIAVQSGWWTRHTSLARFERVQAVVVAETPFDRRWGMRRLRIDTAGQGRAGHQLALAFLPGPEALSLYQQIRSRAAATELHW